MPVRYAATTSLLLSLAIALPNVKQHYDVLERRGEAISQQIHIPALQAAGMTAFLEKAVPFADPSGLEVSPHTIPITAVQGTSPTQRLINLMMIDEPSTPADDEPMAAPEAEAADPPAKADPPPAKGGEGDGEGKSGSSPIKNVNDIVFMTAATVGGQNFQMVLDTGSADSWLVSTPFTCLNNRQQETNVKVCKFAKEYKKSATFKQSAGLRLQTAYADGERLQGIIGTETFSMGGITVQNQTFGLVQKANWHGDGFSSGLMGMAFPSVTRAMAGDGISAKAQHYDPVFFNMYKKKLIKPVFAVALNRKNEGPGAVSLGGLPGGNIKYKAEFAKAPMEKMSMKGAAAGKADFTLYLAKASGFTVNGKKINITTNLVVDSGTTLSFLPNEVVKAIAAAWTPPLQPNPLTGQMLTSCTSKPPKVGVIIGGKELFMDGEDLAIKAGPNSSMCMIGVQGAKGLGGAGLNLLGGPFMKSVVSVFDVGAAEMRFHQRVRG